MTIAGGVGRLGEYRAARCVRRIRRRCLPGLPPTQNKPRIAEERLKRPEDRPMIAVDQERLKVLICLFAKVELSIFRVIKIL